MSPQVVNYFKWNWVEALGTFFIRAYSFFRNEIFRKLSFRDITSGIVSSKWISPARHALAALLLAPKLLMPRKITGTDNRDYLQNRSQLDRLLFGMGNPFS